MFFRVGSSMYHTIGNAVFHFLEAVLLFEPVSKKISGELFSYQVKVLFT